MRYGLATFLRVTPKPLIKCASDNVSFCVSECRGGFGGSTYGEGLSHFYTVHSLWPRLSQELAAGTRKST